MREYLLKRLCLLIPTFIGITLVVYTVLLLLPGDPVDVLLGQEYDVELAQRLRAEWAWTSRSCAIRQMAVAYCPGRLGRSMFSRKPVFDEVMAKLPLTLELVVLALFFELLISVPAGVISAVKPYTWWDYGASTFALIGVSIPSFFLGILLFLTFGLWLGWLPVQGYVPFTESVSENLRHLLLPTVALGVARTAILTRLIRASMLEVIRQEYVITARSKGLAERIVINKHALKNALIPAVTVLGLQVGFLVGGAIIIEKLFALPGIGSYGIDAISNRDYPQVLGFILVSAVVFQFANLCVDFVYCRSPHSAGRLRRKGAHSRGRSYAITGVWLRGKPSGSGSASAMGRRANGWQRGRRRTKDHWDVAYDLPPVTPQSYGLFGLGIACLVFLVAAPADVIARYGYAEMHPEDMLQTPAPSICWAPTRWVGMCSVG